MKNLSYRHFIDQIYSPYYVTLAHKQPEPGWCVESCFRTLLNLRFRKEAFLTPPNVDGLDPIEMKMLAAAYGLVLIEEADYIDEFAEETLYMGITYLDGVNHSVLLCYNGDTELALTVYDPATGAIGRKATSQLRVNRLYRLYATPRMADI